MLDTELGAADPAFHGLPDQVVDAERGSGVALRKVAQDRCEETGELWHLLLVVSSGWAELPAHPLLVLMWRY